MPQESQMQTSLPTIQKSKLAEPRILFYILMHNIFLYHLHIKQDSRFGELASLAYLDCGRARSHLTNTKPVNTCFKPKIHIQKIVEICLHPLLP